MLKNTVTQNDTWTWSSDAAGISQNVERLGNITRLHFTVEVTPSATLTAANQPDGLFRVIQNLVVKGGGNSYIELPADDGCEGGVLLHYMGQADGFGYGHYNAAIAAPQTLYSPINFPIHIGTRPRDIWGRDNPYDLSAFIPAGELGSLTAVWTTSGNDVMDDGVTISSAVMYLTISRVEGTEAEIMAEMARQGIPLPRTSSDPVKGMVPNWIQKLHANAATTTAFAGETEDVPADGFLKRIALLFQDATATRTLRASDEVTEVALYWAGSNQWLLAHHVEIASSLPLFGSNLKLGDTVGASVDNSIDFGAEAPYGLSFLDLRTLRDSPVGREYGFDLRAPYSSGQLKLGFIISTRAAGDDTLIVWERYQPYYGRLGK